MNVIRYLLLACLTVLITGSCAEAEPLHCLEFKGVGYPYDGGYLFVSSRGLKCGGRNGWLLWSKKNVGSLIVINPENKTYMVAPVSKRGLEDDEVRKRQPAKISVVKEGTATICGLKCNRYSVAPVIAGASVGAVYMEFWTCSQTPCDKVASDAWSQASDIPTGYGLPLRVRRAYREAMVTTMDTTSVKPVEKTPEFFVLDPTYHRATDRAGLMFSKNGVLKAGDLDDLFINPGDSVKH